jgi:hypothetical protein
MVLHRDQNKDILFLFIHGLNYNIDLLHFTKKTKHNITPKQKKASTIKEGRETKINRSKEKEEAHHLLVLHFISNLALLILQLRKVLSPQASENKFSVLHILKCQRFILKCKETFQVIKRYL